MAQIIPRNDFGSALGQSLGTGLSQGLQQVANLKLKEFHQRQQARQLKEGGLPEVLAYLDPQVQAQYLRGAQAAKTESQKENVVASLQDELSKLNQSGEGATNLLGQQPDAGPGNLLGQQPDAGAANLFSQQGVANLLGQQGGRANLADAAVPDIAVTKDPSEPIKQVEAIKSAANITPKTRSQEARLKKEIEDLQVVKDNPKLNSRVRAQAAKELEGKSKRFDKLEDKLFTATKDIRDEVTKDLKENNELRATLELQKELNERGGIDTPGFLSFLKNAGLDIDALKTGNTQAFIKANGIHFKNIKKLFGARPSEGEVRLYMKTIANEFQSPEGRRRIIDMMLIGANSVDIRGKAMEDIIQDNGGLPPRDLAAQIERRSRKDIKNEYKKFKEIINRPELAGQNKFITAAQATAGKALPVIGGAGLGGIIGSLAGPGGTLAGSLLGGVAPAALSGLKDLLSSLGK